MLDDVPLCVPEELPVVVPLDDDAGADGDADDDPELPVDGLLVVGVLVGRGCTSEPMERGILEISDQSL